MQEGPKTTERIHPKLQPYLTQGNLITPQLSIQAKKKQLLYELNSPKTEQTGEFILPHDKEYPGLKMPLFIGEYGKLILLYDQARLGRGAQGKIFLGVDVNTHETYAVKVLPFETKDLHHPKKAALAKKRFTKQIQEEENTLRALQLFVDRTEIVLKARFDAIECDKGTSVIISVQKLAWGEDLFKYKKGEKNAEASSIYTYSDEEKLEIAIQFLERINELHEKGFVHRDIKLENAIWDQETKTLRLVDFGLAKKMKAGKFAAPKGGAAEGTLACIAPELIENQTYGNHIVYSAATDMYAAGVSLARLFSKNDLMMSNHEFASQIIAISEAREKTGIKDGLPPLLAQKGVDVFLQTQSSPFKNALYNYLKEMVDISPRNRTDFKTAISALKTLQAQMSIEETASAAKEKSFDFGSFDLNLLDEFLERKIKEQEAAHADKASPLFFSATLPPSLPISNPQQKIKEDAAFRQTLQYISKDLDEYIHQIQNQIQQKHLERGKSLFLSHNRQFVQKQQMLDDAKDLLKKITECDKKEVITTGDLLNLGFSVIDKRGKHHQRILPETTSSEDNSAFHSFEGYDEILKSAQDKLALHLEKVPAFRIMAKLNNPATKNTQRKNNL